LDPDTQQEKVLRYLYGDMSNAEIEAFEREIQQDEALRNRLEEEQRFNRIVPLGSGDPPDSALLERGRQELDRALRQEKRTRWLPNLGNRSRGWKVFPYAVAAAALLLVGVSMDWTETPTDQANRIDSASRVDSTNRVDLASRDTSPTPSDILDIVVTEVDPFSNRIRFTARVVTLKEIEGAADDPSIQAYLAQAIGSDTGPGIRLDLLERLDRVPEHSPVLDALIRVLTNDPNPAVRLKAVSALASHVGNPLVRRAFLSALSNDVNPGVRVLVIDALQNVTQQDLAGGVRRVAETDRNPYVKAEAARLANRLGKNRKL
jgi:hypothetical protein